MSKNTLRYVNHKGGYIIAHIPTVYVGKLCCFITAVLFKQVESSPESCSMFQDQRKVFAHLSKHICLLESCAELCSLEQLVCSQVRVKSVRAASDSRLLG